MIKITGSILAIIFLFSCSQAVPMNHSDATVDMQGAISKTDNVISFKVNGSAVVTSGWTISRVKWSTDPSRLWLNITSNMHQDKRTIGVNLNGSVPGTYVLGLENGALSGQSHGSYHADYADLSDSYSFISGSFVITEVDLVKLVINGTFSGTVQNNKGESLSITDGKIINGKLNGSINSY